MTKAPADLRSLARAHTELGIQTLAGIARNSTSDAARVQAVGMLLDRGWGKVPQPHTVRTATVISASPFGRLSRARNDRHRAAAQRMDAARPQQRCVAYLISGRLGD